MLHKKFNQDFATYNFLSKKLIHLKKKSVQVLNYLRAFKAVHKNNPRMCPRQKNKKSMLTTAAYFNVSGAQREYLKYSIQGTNSQLPNISYKLFIFNCLTLKITLFIFKLFDTKFLFSENHVFRKHKRTAVYRLMDARPQFRILNSPGKMITCYLRGTLCKSILKCGFPTKGIELTRFVLFEVL